MKHTTIKVLFSYITFTLLTLQKSVQCYTGYNSSLDLLNLNNENDSPLIILVNKVVCIEKEWSGLGFSHETMQLD